MMKKKYLQLLFCALMIPSGVEAGVIDDVQVGSSPNPLGSGARALGMGSAFIGFADDATAASWNPAGLIQLESPEISVVGSYLRREEGFTALNHPEAANQQSFASTDLNYLSLATPVQLPWTHAVVSLNFQTLYDLEQKMGYRLSNRLDDPSGASIDYNKILDFRQSGVLRALSPAIAVQITPFLSLGLTVNWWTDQLGIQNGWNSTQTEHATGNFTIPSPFPELFPDINNPFDDFVSIEKQYDQVDGINANIGLLWEINDMIRFGAVYKSATSLDMTRTTTRNAINSITVNEIPETTTSPATTVVDDITLHLPPSYGVGVALKMSDSLSFAADIYHTNWKEFYLLSPDNEPISPLDGALLSDSGVKATTQFRLGGEYLWILPTTVIPFRAGLYYDPQPAPDGVDQVYGVSLGTGYMIDNVVIDIAYTYDRGQGLNGNVSGIEDSQYNMSRHRLYASCIVYFE
ncbi:MAG: outer membrane protein transport protein [Mariprofundaceae bacterium]